LRLKKTPSGTEPIGLLLLGTLLFGGKTGIEFSVWGFFCLLFCLKRFKGPGFTALKYDFVGTGLIILGATFCLSFSLDRSISLYWTTQLFTYAFLWLALRVECEMQPDTPSLDLALLILGVYTAGLTICQTISGRISFGFLPVNPNFNAVWMAVLAVFLMARSRDERQTPKRRWIEIILAGILSGLVICGHSRGALAAWTIGVCFLILHLFGWRMAIKVLSGIAVVALLLPGGRLWSRLHLSDVNGLRGERIHFWKIAAQAIKDYPLTGYGAGNFEIAYQRHPFPVMEDPVRFGRTTEFAHNEYLQLLCELGMPTGGLLLLAMGWLLSFPVNKQRPIALASKAGLVTLMGSGLFNPVFHMPLLVYLALLLGSLSISDSERRRKFLQRTRNNSWTNWGIRFGILSTMFLTIWTGMRYYWASQQRWDRILTFDARDADAWHNAALGELNPSLAAQDSENAVHLSPLQPYYQESLGHALEATQKLENMPPAINAYEKTILEAPARATAMLGIGRVLVRQNNPAAAIIWFERARQIEPFYWEADLWIARCLYMMGDKKRAASIIVQLPKRREQFLSEFGDRAQPNSSYAQAILGYDDRVVKAQLELFQKY